MATIKLLSPSDSFLLSVQPGAQPLLGHSADVACRWLTPDRWIPLWWSGHVRRLHPPVALGRPVGTEADLLQDEEVRPTGEFCKTVLP